MCIYDHTDQIITQTNSTAYACNSISEVKIPRNKRKTNFE